MQPQIMIIDDEWMNIEVLQIMLKACGFASDYSTCGIEGLEKIKERYRLAQEGNA